MTTRMRGTRSKNDEQYSFDEFIRGRSRLTFGLILIALGLIFLLQQAHVLDAGSSWWVIFIAIPGLVALGSATVDFLQTNEITRRTISQIVSGVLLLVLSVIFIWDPTWSFTRGWQLDKAFPFLHNMGNLWQWLVLALGIICLVASVYQKSIPLGIVGGILCIVGAVFILNISWNAVWPLFLIGLGVWLLFKRTREV